MDNLQEIILKLDKKTVDFLSDEVKKKRASGISNSFADIFLIRLTEALNNKLTTQVFKIRENKPAIRARV